MILPVIAWYCKFVFCFFLLYHKNTLFLYTYIFFVCVAGVHFPIYHLILLSMGKMCKWADRQLTTKCFGSTRILWLRHTRRSWITRDDSSSPHMWTSPLNLGLPKFVFIILLYFEGRLYNSGLSFRSTELSLNLNRSSTAAELRVRYTN